MREINHLSLQQWLRSAIPDSQQPTSPIGFLFLKLPPPPCAVLLVYIHIKYYKVIKNVFPLSNTIFQSSHHYFHRWLDDWDIALPLGVIYCHYTDIVLRKVYVHREIDSHSFQAIGPAKTCELEMETAAAVARVGLQVGQGGLPVIQT